MCAKMVCVPQRFNLCISQNIQKIFTHYILPRVYSINNKLPLKSQNIKKKKKKLEMRSVMSSRNLSIYSFGLFILFTYVLTTSQLVAKKKKNTRIRRLCNKSDDPSFCRVQLNSYNESFDADIDVLAYMAINLTSEFATGEVNEIEIEIMIMKEEITDDETLKDLEVCKTKFEVVVENMREAKNMWNEKNYSETSKIARNSISVLDGCHYRTLEMRYPFVLYINYLQKLLNIVETIGENPDI